MKKRNKHIGWKIFMVLSVSMIISCKKLVDIPPPVSGLAASNIYNNDPTAIAAVTGIYTLMNSGPANSALNPYFATCPGLSADELIFTNGLSNTQYLAYYQNQLSPIVAGSEFWSQAYYYIFNANAAIEGLNAATLLTPAVKQQLLGEAKFVRAFSYFYLINCFGDVPLALSSDYNVNSKLTRSAKGLVYQQIIKDLKDAEGLLSANYLDATLQKTTTERIRPNKGAAQALLAKVYLYIGDYPSAVTEASAVINNAGTYSLNTLNNAFLRASLGNNEAIWQLQPITANQNTLVANIFILPNGGPADATPFYLSPDLIAAFEPGDQRKADWTNNVTFGTQTFYYPYKYKVNTGIATVSEYDMVIRLGEVYLIRAEAEARLGSSTVSAAVSDLNVIRQRAGLTGYNGASDPTSVIDGILHERRVELFTEWGNRWFDLIRTGKVNTVMGSPMNVTQAKGGTWTPNAALYPLPLSDIQKDPNLVQNPGY